MINIYTSANKTTSLSMARAVFVIFLLWSTFYAPLKWILNLAGVGFLFYIPKFALLISIIVSVFLTRKINKQTVFFIIAVFISSIYGLYVFGNLSQVLFCIYILVPFAFGLYYGEKLINGGMYKTLIIIWAMISIGVLLNVVIQYPWAGAVMDIDGGAIYIAKEWTTYDVTRYAGFSVASYSVATQLLAIGVYLICVAKTKKIKVIFFVVTFILLVLTTTKGAIFSLAAVGLLLFFYTNKKIMLHKILIIVLIIDIILPILSLSYSDSLVYSGNRGGSWLLTTETIYERMTWMWPESLSFILHKGNVIMGAGMGGIGTALSLFYQQFDENALRFASADNIFIYTFGLFGVLGAIALFVLCKKASKINWQDDLSIYVYMSTLSMLLFGLVGAPFEREFWLVFLGITIQIAFKNTNQAK